MPTDQMQKFLFVNEGIRGVFVSMPETLQAIMHQHHYPAVLFDSLGSCLLSSVLLANRIKFKGDLTMQLEISGAISLLVAKCSDALDVRGLARWDETADSQQLVADFSQGRLVLTVASKRSSQRFQSIVELKGDSLASALDHYFIQSEQLPTRVMLEVSSGSGVIIQAMPDQPLNDALWQQVSRTSSALEDGSLAPGAKSFLASHFSEYDIQLFDSKPVQFRCHCSHERMQSAVKSLGKNEIEQILSEFPAINVTCEYCNQQYSFSAQESRSLF